MDEIAVLWRVANIVGSLAAIPMVYGLIRRNRGEISRRSMSLMQSLLFTHVMILIVSCEALYRHEPLSVRAALFSVIVGWTILAFAMPKAVMRRDETS